MSFNILLICFILCALSIPIVGIFCFKWGFRFGNEPEKAAETKIVELPKVKKKKMSKEQKVMQQVAENIDNYCGDATGQKEIRA